MCAGKYTQEGGQFLLGDNNNEQAIDSGVSPVSVPVHLCVCASVCVLLFCLPWLLYPSLPGVTTTFLTYTSRAVSLVCGLVSSKGKFWSDAIYLQPCGV